ncbi:MAG: LiaI-LiaF-like domain-containing protein [Terriglobia bacterium]
MRIQNGIGGPLVLILIGVLFLLNEFAPDLGISRTWPVILIAVGILLLFRSASPPRPPQGPRL